MTPHLPNKRYPATDLLDRKVHQDGNHLITYPTGSGKTHLSVRATQHALEKGMKAVLVVPLKAIAEELASTLSAHHPKHQVKALTSDHLLKTPLSNLDVIITTPERLDLISRTWRKNHLFIAQLDLVVIDEIHLLSTRRGARIDAALTRLRTINPLFRIMALSATVGEPQRLAQWLGASHWHSDERPVPLKFHIHTHSNPKQKFKTLLTILNKNKEKNENYIIFVNSRKKSEEISAFLNEENIPSKPHHAGLEYHERQAAEQAFKTGETKVIVATSTLEMGVNLPANHVILFNLSNHQNGTFERLKVTEVWQRAGRAGRDPTQVQADVHLLALPSEEKQDWQSAEYETITSGMREEIMLQDTLIGNLQAGITRQAQMKRFFKESFMGTHHQSDTATLLDQLTRDGAVQITQSANHQHPEYKLTPLGQVAARHLLPTSVLAHAQNMPSEGNLLDLLIYTLEHPHFKELKPDSKEHIFLLDIHRQHTPSLILNTRYVDDLTLHSATTLEHACETTLIEAAKVARTYPSTIRSLRDEVLRVWQAWTALHPLHQLLRLSHHTLHTEIPFGSATIALLHGMGKVRSRQLIKAGFEHLEEISTAEETDFQSLGWSEKRIHDLQTQAQKIVKTLDGDPTTPPTVKNRNATQTWQADICPRRLERALHLLVKTNEKAAEKEYQVSGGESVHHTSETTCDCLDWQPNRPCKHQLAVQLLSNTVLQEQARHISDLDLQLFLLDHQHLNKHQ